MHDEIDSVETLVKHSINRDDWIEKRIYRLFFDA